MMKTGGKLNKRPASNKRTPGISAHYQGKKFNRRPRRLIE